MTRLLDKLNLRPQERRLVIFVAVVVFVALNWFFVKPYFGELGRLKKAMKTADDNIARFSAEIQKKSTYEKQIAQLSSEGGQVATADMVTTLIRDLNTQAGNAGVNIQSLNPAPSSHESRTNAAFDEQTATLTFGNTGEPELINFLFSLASQKSLIRVKSLILRPDPGHMKLGGTLTLVESFQKKAPPKPAASASAATPVAAKPAPVAPKPATTPAKPTNAPPTSKPKPASGKTNEIPKPFSPASSLKKP